MKKAIFIFIIFTNQLCSQNDVIPDTSFTINSAYIKEIMKFPFIKVAEPEEHDNVIETKNIIYKELEGRKLHLDAYISKEGDNNPGIILLHGGGWKSGNKSHMAALASEIASNGYSCFAVEYRLSPEAVFPAGIFDVKSAVKFIKYNAYKFRIDSAKMTVLGCSSGGQMAALVGTTNNNPEFEDKNISVDLSSSVQAIIDIDGILAFKHPESQEDVVAGMWLGGSYEAIPETWKKASALSHADKNTPPILFINSQFERFHAGRDDLIEILRSNSIYFQVETIENSPHTFWLFHPWFEKTTNFVVGFLDKLFKENKT